MKALTIRQPWASLVALRRKTVETRSWATKYRGPLRIHAAARVPNWVLPLNIGGFAVDKDNPRGTSPAYLLRGPIAWPYRLPLGAIVATANLVDCVPMVDADEPMAKHHRDHERWVAVHPNVLTLSGRDGAGVAARSIHDQRPFGDFAPGRWAWLLDDVKPTTERCPANCEDGGVLVDSATLYGIPGGEDWAACEVCNGKGHCDPVPAKGRQGLWEWTP